MNKNNTNCSLYSLQSIVRRVRNLAQKRETCTRSTRRENVGNHREVCELRPPTTAVLAIRPIRAEAAASSIIARAVPREDTCVIALSVVYPLFRYRTCRKKHNGMERRVTVRCGTRSRSVLQPDTASHTMQVSQHTRNWPNFYMNRNAEQRCQNSTNSV